MIIDHDHFYLCEAAVNNNQSNSQKTYITAIDGALQITDTVKNILDLFLCPICLEKNFLCCVNMVAIPSYNTHWDFGTNFKRGFKVVRANIEQYKIKFDWIYSGCFVMN